ncbi:DUF6183 family protein [Streptomyces mirabilis]
MAGLSGAPEGASADEVERHARQSSWFHFEADTDWFHNDIGSDYGIAALSPDCRRIAVLAATDTDWRQSRSTPRTGPKKHPAPSASPSSPATRPAGNSWPRWPPTRPVALRRRPAERRTAARIPRSAGDLADGLRRCRRVRRSLPGWCSSS